MEVRQIDKRVLSHEVPGQVHRQQNNPIRLLRKLYEPWINERIPATWTADDVVFNRVFGMRRSVDDVVAQIGSEEPDKYSLRQDKIRFMVSAVLDLGDGARARAENADQSVRNQLVDVAADRIDETYTATKLAFLLFEKNGDNPDVLMTALHLARDVSVPTMARYYGNAFGIFIPEKDPPGIGGARADKIKFLFSALRHVTHGKYTEAFESLQRLDDIVKKADEYRRSRAQLHDAEAIASLDPSQYTFEDASNLRTNFEIGLHLMDLFFESHDWIRSQLSNYLQERGIDQELANELIERYDREARDEQINPGSALYFSLCNDKSGRETVREIREKWQAVFSDEFQSYPDLSLESFLARSPRPENYLTNPPTHGIRRRIYDVIA